VGQTEPPGSVHMRSGSEILRLAKVELERLGATHIRAVSGGKHPRIEYRKPDGTPGMQIYSWSPSDKRSVRNFIAQIRQEMGASNRGRPRVEGERREKRAPRPRETQETRPEPVIRQSRPSWPTDEEYERSGDRATRAYHSQHGSERSYESLQPH